MDGHHEQLIDMVLDTFGDKVARVDDLKPKHPVKSYWKRGYQVIVVYHNTDQTKKEKYEGILYQGAYVRSPWPEANNTNDLHRQLKIFSVEKRHAGAFFVMQGILTPDGELIKNQIMKADGISIRRTAPRCNCNMADWITGDLPGTKLMLSRSAGGEDEEEEGRPNSVVIIDYAEFGSVLPAVINSNRVE
jgi:hypothetical protein